MPFRVDSKVLMLVFLAEDECFCSEDTAAELFCPFWSTARLASIERGWDGSESFLRAAPWLLETTGFLDDKLDSKKFELGICTGPSALNQLSNYTDHQYTPEKFLSSKQSSCLFNVVEMIQQIWHIWKPTHLATCSNHAFWQNWDTNHTTIWNVFNWKEKKVQMNSFQDKQLCRYSHPKNNLDPGIVKEKHEG